ncbi:hypothetical protein Vafri_9396, partial [Volvox africanus]
GAPAAAVVTSTAAGGGGDNSTESAIQGAAVLASMLVNHLALPLVPDVSALGLTGPGLTAAEAQAIQLVCTSIKGPELAVAVKGIMDSLAGRPTATVAAATGAAVSLMTLPPGGLEAPSPASIANGDGAGSAHIAAVTTATIPATTAAATSAPQTLPAVEGVTAATTVQATPPAPLDQGLKKGAPMQPVSVEESGGLGGAGVTAAPATAATSSSPATQAQPMAVAVAVAPAASVSMDVDGVKAAS